MAHSSEIEKLERRWMDNPMGLTFAPLAEAYRRAGDHPRALEVLELGLAQHPAYVPALIVQARCHVDGGLDGAAEAAFARVLDSDRHNLIALKGLADICERAGRVEDALGFVARLLDADPTHDDGRTQHARLRDLAGARQAVLGAAAGAVEPPAPVAEPVEPTAAVLPEPVEPVESVAAGWSGLVVPEPALPEPVIDPLPPTFEPADQVEPVEAGASSGESDVDPAAWGLALEGVEIPLQPFEESEPLEPITLEQVQEAGVALGVQADGVLESAPEAPIEPDETGPVPVPAEGGWLEPPSAALVEERPAETLDSAAEPGESFDAFFGLGEPPPMDTQDAPEAEPERVGAGPVPDAAPEQWPLEGPAEVAWDEMAAAAESGTPDWLELSHQEAETLIGSAAAPEPPVSDHLPSVSAALEGDQASMERVEPPPTEAPEESWVESAGGDFAALESIPEWEPPLPPVSEAGPTEAAAMAEAPSAEPQIAQPEDEAVFERGDADPVEVVEGAADEMPAEAPATLEAPVVAAEAEPALVVTETMAEIFLRQGHRTLALAVYAELLQREPESERLRQAVQSLRSELEPEVPVAGDEPVGAFLSRVLDPEAGEPDDSVSVGSGSEAGESPAGRPTQPAEDPALHLSSIFGDDAHRSPRSRSPQPSGEATGGPTFDEFFGAQGVPAGAAGEDADLEQFNAWLRSLQR